MYSFFFFLLFFLVLCFNIELCVVCLFLHSLVVLLEVGKEFFLR
jgi:hypothetical protein